MLGSAATPNPEGLGEVAKYALLDLGGDKPVGEVGDAAAVAGAVAESERSAHAEAPVNLDRLFVLGRGFHRQEPPPHRRALGRDL